MCAWDHPIINCEALFGCGLGQQRLVAQIIPGCAFHLQVQALCPCFPELRFMLFGEAIS
jgi:hypothetical protein